ncbi:MAG: membrane protein insertase YidC [Steroidobacteraceae bacterium]
MFKTNLRPFLWAALGVLLFLNYQMWQKDYPALPPGISAAGAATPALDAAAPVAAAPNAADTPAANGTDAPVAGATAAAPAAAAATAPAETLRVTTDVLTLDISLRGGELVHALLPDYPLQKDRPDVPVELFRNKGAGDLYVMQTGLAGTAADQVRPTHLATFTSPFREFTLLEGASELRVPLTWTSPEGVTVTKTYVFRRGAYRVDLEYSVQNDSDAPFAVASYAQVKHDTPPVERSYFNVSTYAFVGPAIYDGTKYRKLKITDSDDARLNQTIKHGWLAALQHHFVSAMIPPADKDYQYSLRVKGNEYVASLMGPVVNVEPKTTAKIEEVLFVGPKLQKQLDAIHPELSRVADYGMLTILSKPLFWVLEKIHAMFGNWGVAIILTTFLLKLLFYPLSEASGKSMARMKTLAPRMKNLQEQYKDDREKLGRAMMDLYKREKVNPAAGCLPILIQFPVFIAFYWVLLESVEMRQAPFFGWIQDLSSRDPYFILPIIMAGAMFLQYKLQPTPADPVQAKVFMILPIVMSVTFAFFPSGLVLYWVTNTVLTIAQQWNINRRIEAAAAARR